MFSEICSGYQDDLTSFNPIFLHNEKAHRAHAQIRAHAQFTDLQVSLHGACCSEYHFVLRSRCSKASVNGSVRMLSR